MRREWDFKMLSERSWQQSASPPYRWLLPSPLGDVPTAGHGEVTRAAPWDMQRCCTGHTPSLGTGHHSVPTTKQPAEQPQSSEPPAPQDHALKQGSQPYSCTAAIPQLRSRRPRPVPPPHNKLHVTQVVTHLVTQLPFLPQNPRQAPIMVGAICSPSSLDFWMKASTPLSP